MYIKNSGHMTKMAAMSIYGKNPSKIFFSGIGGLDKPLLTLTLISTLFSNSRYNKHNEYDITAHIHMYKHAE